MRSFVFIVISRFGTSAAADPASLRGIERRRIIEQSLQDRHTLANSISSKLRIELALSVLDLECRSPPMDVDYDPFKRHLLF